MKEMKEKVQEYYGKVLKGSADLKTSTCCTNEELPPHVRPILPRIHEEVSGRYYGCGLVLPDSLEGCTVLDLGCGAGRDLFILSSLVGPSGRAIGVDMTLEQLDVARKYQEYHRQAFGHPESNVHILEGEIEELEGLGIPAASVDVVVSNCVVNLVENKRRVFEGVARVLKPGGEFYFSDVYADRRVPEELRADEVLYGECLSGALYWNDFLSVARSVGFGDPRLVESRTLTVDDPELARRTKPVRFFSATCRLFGIEGLEPVCEDYGQAVRYRGTIPFHANLFRLDDHHIFESGRIVPVCGNTFRMLRESRFGKEFDFYGDFDRHFGVFPGCGASLPEAAGEDGGRPDRPDSCC